MLKGQKRSVQRRRSRIYFWPVVPAPVVALLLGISLWHNWLSAGVWYVYMQYQFFWIAGSGLGPARVLRLILQDVPRQRYRGQDWKDFVPQEPFLFQCGQQWPRMKVLGVGNQNRFCRCRSKCLAAFARRSWDIKIQTGTRVSSLARSRSQQLHTRLPWPEIWTLQPWECIFPLLWTAEFWVRMKMTQQRMWPERSWLSIWLASLADKV